MEDGNSWISLLACYVIVVSCELPTEHCVVNKACNELNHSGHDCSNWGMMHAAPCDGQRKQRYFADSWAPCLEVKRERRGRSDRKEKSKAKVFCLVLACLFQTCGGSVGKKCRLENRWIRGIDGFEVVFPVSRLDITHGIGEKIATIRSSWTKRRLEWRGSLGGEPTALLEKGASPSFVRRRWVTSTNGNIKESGLMLLIPLLLSLQATKGLQF